MFWELPDKETGPQVIMRSLGTVPNIYIIIFMPLLGLLPKPNRWLSSQNWCCCQWSGIENSVSNLEFHWLQNTLKVLWSHDHTGKFTSNLLSKSIVQPLLYWKLCPPNPFRSDPIPSQPIPSQPVPSQPIPSQPIPSQPIPADPIPPRLISSHPVPTDPIPTIIEASREGLYYFWLIT